MSESDRLVGLLNEVKLAADKESKEDLFGQIEELCLNKRPALLKDHLGALLEFVSDTSTSGRKFCIRVMEEAIKQSNDHVPAVVAPLMFLFDETNNSLLKKIIGVLEDGRTGSRGIVSKSNRVRNA